MKIVIAGPKSVGKSTIGRDLAAFTGLRMIETDDLIEEHFAEETGEHLTCRQLYEKYGEEKFRAIEKHVAGHLQEADWSLIVSGGSSLVDPDCRRALRNNAILIYLKGDAEEIWQRLEKNGLPPWMQHPHARVQLEANMTYRETLLAPYADIVIDTSGKDPKNTALEVYDLIGRELSIRSVAANTYGDVIRVTTFGESHGPAIGAVLDGVRPGTEISDAEIQKELNRRRPGQSEVTTPRDEKDKVEILSGVFKGKATGAPIAMVIFNRDHDSSKYEGIKDLFRPGHADFTYYQKYGIRDYRGGGRSSGRETAGRVMCGAVVKQMLAERGITVIAHSVEIAGIPSHTCDHSVIESNPVRCADPEAAKAMEQAILDAKEDNDSVGGIVKLEVLGLPAGLGDPVFGKIDAKLTHAIMTIGAIKAIEVGRGFELAKMRGSESNDDMCTDGNGFVSNNAGGITGGISTGQPVEFRMAVKPTSSIAKPQKTIDLEGKDRDIETHGRHDPCLVPRIIPVIETMASLAIYDMLCVQERLRPDKPLE